MALTLLNRDRWRVVETDYEILLARAREGLDDVMTDEARFVLPDPEVLHEGKRTIFRNFADVLDAIRREELHFADYLKRKLGTVGQVDGRRLVVQGRVSERNIAKLTRTYVDTFVLCDECHRPDTHMEREGRTLMLRCEACGAHRPIRTGN